MNLCKTYFPELDELVQELDEDVEGMQSTICYLQQELRETKGSKGGTGSDGSGPRPSTNPNNTTNSSSGDCLEGLVVHVSLSDLCAQCRTVHEPKRIEDDTKIRTRASVDEENEYVDSKSMEVDLDENETDEDGLILVTGVENDERTCVVNGESDSSPPISSNSKSTSNAKSLSVQNVVNSSLLNSTVECEDEEADRDSWTRNQEKAQDHTDAPPSSKRTKLHEVSPSLVNNTPTPPEQQCPSSVNGNGALEH